MRKVTCSFFDSIGSTVINSSAMTVISRWIQQWANAAIWTPDAGEFPAGQKGVFSRSDGPSRIAARVGAIWRRHSRSHVGGDQAGGDVTMSTSHLPSPANAFLRRPSALPGCIGHWTRGEDMNRYISSRY